MKDDNINGKRISIIEASFAAKSQRIFGVTIQNSGAQGKKRELNDGWFICIM